MPDHCITIIACSNIEERWFAWLTAEYEREEAEFQRALDTADRLGLRMPDDDAHGNVLAVCEGCIEDWPHGLEIVGGAALCQPCIDALDGGEVQHAG
jgi:hypothetical protein